MKNIKEWLEIIKDPIIRNKAIHNSLIDNHIEYDTSIEVESIADAIIEAFYWTDSIEGWK